MASRRGIPAWRRWPLLAAVLASACQATEGAEVIRAGFAVGLTQSQVCIDRDRQGEGVPDVDLEGANGYGGFAEAVIADGSWDLHVRAVARRSEHDVADSGTVADVREFALLPMVSTRVPVFDGVDLKPLFGMGLGYTDVDLDPLLGLGERSGPTFVLAVGGEFEVARHATIGAMWWGSLNGSFGDTEATFGVGMVYVGVRF